MPTGPEEIDRARARFKRVICLERFLSDKQLKPVFTFGFRGCDSVILITAAGIGLSNITRAGLYDQLSHLSLVAANQKLIHNTRDHLFGGLRALEVAETKRAGQVASLPFESKRILVPGECPQEFILGELHPVTCILSGISTKTVLALTATRS